MLESTGLRVLGVHILGPWIRVQQDPGFLFHVL
jgi:hypothetical protein